MLCAISFIFIISIVDSLESGNLSMLQAIFYGAYGLLMLYHTSKPHWTENQKGKHKRKY